MGLRVPTPPRGGAPEFYQMIRQKLVPAVVILFHLVKLLFLSVLRTGRGLVVSLLRSLFTLLMLFVIFAPPLRVLRINLLHLLFVLSQSPTDSPSPQVAQSHIESSHNDDAGMIRDQPTDYDHGLCVLHLLRDPADPLLE